MPSKSPAQARLMRAVSHGWKPDRIAGPTKAVATEFMKADQAKKPKKAMGGMMRSPVQNGLLAGADRALRTANNQLLGLPGTRRGIGTPMRGFAKGGRTTTAYAKGGLTRQHFQRAADIIKKHGEAGIAAGAKTPVAHDMAKDLADWFQSTNDRFDRKRFLKAAGVPDDAD